MTIGSVLTQIFRPAHFEASRAAKAMVNNRAQARASIAELLESVRNGITCNSHRGTLAETGLRDILKASTFDLRDAKQAVTFARHIQRDLGQQIQRARNQAGGMTCWYMDQAKMGRKVADMASQLQHFSPTGSK